MKNVEEDILKRFLQDTFSDYEPEPSDQTWENIRKEIQPKQPKVGAGLKPWIVPVVALLLLIGGVVWNIKEHKNNNELALNSTHENGSIKIQSDGNRPFEGRLPYVDKIKKSEKIYVNVATPKVKSKLLLKVEKLSKVPTFSTIVIEQNVKPKVQDYSVNSEKFVGMDDKSAVLPNVTPVVISRYNDKGLRKVISEDTDNNVISRDNDSRLRKVVSLSDLVKIENNRKEKSLKPINLTNPNSDENDATIQEIRYIKPLETIKNKDFVLVKNIISLPEISNILINKDPKPLRRPTFMSVSIIPIQTYRIFTVNHLGVQNLQTNKLFDAERNGWAFELGITKPIGDKWNFRGGVAYVKMRQWAEYQVNTNNISVKNSNNNSNPAVVVGNGTEFIGQTQVEQKNLQMMGLKGDIQKFFKVSGRNRYFISGGSQLMYEPNEKQTNVFINASAGFQHVVNKDLFLTIEPTASYLLNYINDSKSLIQTNAYNLGLKVGVNFRVK